MDRKEMEDMRMLQEKIVQLTEELKKQSHSAQFRRVELLTEELEKLTIQKHKDELQSELSEAKLDIVRNQNIILEMEQEAKEVKERLGKITGDTSDGYHTFNELYEHRVLLWINLVLLEQKNSYLVENHFDGWFLLGMETKAGLISYHCPNKYLYLVSRVQRRNPVYDGHTSNDVIERLKKVAQALVTAINERKE